MSEEDMDERWERLTEGEFLMFEQVSPKRSRRPDLHAFLLLDELFTGTNNIVAAAAHDEIWLDIEGEDVANLSDDQIIELARCGVMYDSENDSLCMFA